MKIQIRSETKLDEKGDVETWYYIYADDRCIKATQMGLEAERFYKKIKKSLTGITLNTQTILKEDHI